MKLDELVTFVEKFILDIIGVVLPGVILLIGLAATLSSNFLAQQWSWAQLSTTGKWVVLLILAYASGHGLHVIGDKVLLPIFGYFTHSGVQTPKAIVERIEKGASITAFKQAVDKTHKGMLPDESKQDFYSTRSLAMSVAPDVEPLTYKFMFISLMNLGAATAVFIVGVVFALKYYGMVNYAFLKFAITAVSLLILLPWVFLLKFSEFHRRALGVPFATATVKLLRDADEGKRSQEKDRERPVLRSRCTPVVYLAGGFISGWQDVAMTACPDADYLDPRTHGLTEPSTYTAWDLNAIRECDIVFAVLEVTNPGGYALALELGYARSRGKYVILVDEKSSLDPSIRRYLAMLHAVSDEVYDSLEVGILALGRMITIVKSE